jgi:hypothetical protein
MTDEGTLPEGMSETAEHHSRLARALKRVLSAVDSAARERVYNAMKELPVVTYGDPCVECGQKIREGDAVTWRLWWLPQGLIHKECQ